MYFEHIIQSHRNTRLSKPGYPIEKIDHMLEDLFATGEQYFTFSSFLLNLFGIEEGPLSSSVTGDLTNKNAQLKMDL